MDEETLYALIRRSGYLAQGALSDWDEDVSERDEYLKHFASETRETLHIIRDALSKQDPTVRSDGMWVKLGLPRE